MRECVRGAAFRRDPKQQLCRHAIWEGTMKTLANVAVFGLVPVPTAPAARDGDDRSTKLGEADTPQRECFLHGITERMPTKDELARILRDLRRISCGACSRK
jgi:hypothetical protein